ncbi:MAG: flagellar biosynthetic protein FliO [Eubacteriales bacterium]|nr:flagellar biosynthetic protein FliO [Eubacteriales bacterium]
MNVIRIYLATNFAGGWLEMVGLVLVTVLILLLTWLTTRWIGRKSQVNQNSRNIQVLERVSVGRDKYMAIIKVADHYYLISVTAQSIQMMAEIDEPEKLKKQPQQVQSFGQLYKTIRERGIHGLTDKPQNSKTADDADIEKDREVDRESDRGDGVNR